MMDVRPLAASRVGTVQDTIRHLDQCGSTPAALFKWYPTASSMAYRDIFDVEVDFPGERQARAPFTNVDARFIGREVYLVVTESVGRGMLETTGHEGTVTLDVDRSARRMSLNASW
ncbi:MAG: hypothetical protein ACOC97_02675 [Myxococcota bacterium]